MFRSSIYRLGSPRFQEAWIAVWEKARRALREGDYFWRALREITDSQWLDRRKLEQLQVERATALIHHAAQHVPYYRRLFSSHGWTPSQFQTLQDISRLPLLTKKQVAIEPKAFVSERPFTWHFTTGTSGTSGTPLTLYQDIRAIARELAFLHRHLEWAGFKTGEPRAWLRGDMVVPVEQHSPPFWRFNRPANMLMLSSYHLSPVRANAYLEALRAFNPVLIQAYPSSIGFLASHLEATGEMYGAPSLRAIITSSESLPADQRLKIERYFGCSVFDHYGATERVVLAGTCEKGALHIEPDYGLTEWIPAEAGGEGECELVGTGFNNRVMPLIRYRTGDRSSPLETETRCPCGREMPVVKRITGRMDDYVITSDGRRVGRLDHIFKGVRFIAEAQIVQREVGAIEIVVVAAGSEDMAAEVEKIRRNALERLGESARIRIDLVSRIPRTANGKLQLVVSELNRDSSVNPIR